MSIQIWAEFGRLVFINPLYIVAFPISKTFFWLQEFSPHVSPRQRIRLSQWKRFSDTSQYKTETEIQTDGHRSGSFIRIIIRSSSNKHFLLLECNQSFRRTITGYTFGNYKEEKSSQQVRYTVTKIIE